MVLVDYNEVLCPPQGWEADLLASVGAKWVFGLHRTEDAVIDVARDAGVVLIQSVRRLLTRRVIGVLSDSCRGIIRVGIGYDSVDVDAATERALPVCNVPHASVEDVADHAIAMLLAGARRLPALDRMMRAGQWEKLGVRHVRRFAGRGLGLVGFGRVARALADRASAIGLSVVAYDPYVSAEDMKLAGAEKAPLDEVLQRADFVSVHTPLNQHTRHMLGAREFALMKPHSVLINTSRGPVIDEAALVEALRQGPLGTAALDVFETEPPDPDSPLLRLDNVIMTPHVAWFSEEGVADLYRSGCEIAIQLLRGEWPASVVNPEVRDRWPKAL